MIGTALGPYQILAKLGEGGMGEVYRARDTTLNRDVAIKILPPADADNADRVARFSREAQTLAALNHPHIAQIYGFEELGGVRALIMELVNGATLADRLAHGPIAAADALRIARQIAEALEAAHALGIVHRDLKPGNIAIRSDDCAKVLDFGLARMHGQTDTAAPTATALSDPGVLLGTVAYMSPEQTLGRPADSRSDIWAFGCVLFEMLTGRRAFGGASMPEMFVAIASRDPDWPALPPAAARAQPLVARCLRKDPKQRLQAIGDARILIDELIGGRSEPAPIPADATRSRRRWTGGAALAAVAIAAAATTWLLTTRSLPKPVLPSTRFEIVPPPALVPAIQGADRDFAVAPDGSFLVYRAGSQAQLIIRRLDRLDAVPVQGVTNARGPFVSPDGKWIGFVENNTNLKKVAVSGGSPVTLAVLPGSPRGAAWIDDSTIVVATNATGLLRVPASGGDATVLTTPDRTRGELGHLHPSALPGGRSILFTIAAVQQADTEIAVLDLETRRTSRLLRGGSDARYVASGHLLYEAGGGTLSAVKFDAQRAVVLGDAVPIVDKVAVSNTGSLNAALTDAGLLIYLRGGLGDAKPRSLSWVDREGRETAFPAPERPYASLRLSPDATRVALEVRDPGPNIWLWDLARETLTPLTFSGGLAPVWTPDGRRVVFASAGTTAPNLYARAADGTGTDTRLTTSVNVQVPTSVTPDGTSVISVERRPQTASDLVRVALDRNTDGSAAAAGVIETSFTEQNGEVSPDGRFLAYESNEYGRFEIYVQPYPTSNGKWRMSSDGGTRPVWTRNGRELVYLDATNHLTIVPVDTNGSTLRPGRAITLPTTAYAATSIAWRTYDVSPDGERFLVIKEPVSTPQDQNFVVVLNFFEELKQRVR